MSTYTDSIKYLKRNMIKNSILIFGFILNLFSHYITSSNIKMIVGILSTFLVLGVWLYNDKNLENEENFKKIINSLSDNYIICDGIINLFIIGAILLSLCKINIYMILVFIGCELGIILNNVLEIKYIKKNNEVTNEI